MPRPGMAMGRPRHPTSARPNIREFTDPPTRTACDAVGVRIEIVVDGTDPPAGQVLHDHAAVPFRGWIDLLAVLSGVLEPARDEDGDLGARTQPELGEDV